jgi:hypothetical protein
MPANSKTKAAMLGGFVLGVLLLSGCGYGPQETVTIQVTGITEYAEQHEVSASAKQQEIEQKLKTMADSSVYAMSITSSGDSMTVKLAPVADVGAFAKKIDFGTILETDVHRRIVKVSLTGKPVRL